MSERIAVSLPKVLIDRIERTRKVLRLNRSKFFLFALTKYLDNVIEGEDRKLENLYKKVEKTDKELLAHFSNNYKNLPVYESR